MELTVEVPRLSNLSVFDLKMSLAAKLYEDGKLSTGHCAEIAGLSKRAFIEMLGNYGVSVFNQSVPEIQSDIEHAGKFFK
jgi:predicted HTH domain antitoxin